MRRLNHFTKHPAFPWLVAGTLSLLLSVLRVATRDVINPDGICYLQSALTVREQHTLALHVCNQSAWPFYQVLIGGLSVLLGGSVLASANVLNALLSLMSVLVFFAISRLLTQNRRIRLFALATILLAHHFNAFRADILRDHGYWAFYLFSMYWLLRYFRSGANGERYRAALLWSGSLLLATLFRLEGIVFLVLLPLSVFCVTSIDLKSRIGSFLQLNSLLLVVVASVFLVLLTHPMQSFGRLDYLFFQMTEGCHVLMRHWHAASVALGEKVLSVYSARDASLVLGLALGDYYLVSLMDVLTLGYFGLVIYAMVFRLMQKPKENQRVLLAYVVVNLLITVFFLAQNFFLARRYLMAMSLTLMFWVPFAMEDLVRQWRVRRWPVILAVFLIVVCSVGGLYQFGTSKKYLREAGDWLALHTPPTTRLYSNDPIVLFYSTHVGNAVFEERPALQAIQEKGRWRHYDWLALRVMQDEKVSISRKPVQVFHNSRNSEVRIYRVNQKGAL